MTIGPRIPFNVAQDALAPMGDKHAGSPGSPSASSSPGRPGVSSSARSGGYRDSRWKFLDGLDRSVHGAASEELAAASSDMGTTITEVPPWRMTPPPRNWTPPHPTSLGATWQEFSITNRLEAAKRVTSQSEQLAGVTSSEPEAATPRIPPAQLLKLRDATAQVAQMKRVSKEFSSTFRPHTAPAEGELQLPAIAAADA